MGRDDRPRRGCMGGCGWLAVLLLVGFIVLVVRSKPRPQGSGETPTASPAPAPSAPLFGKVADDPETAKRYAIYLELHEAGMQASDEANARYPFSALEPGDQEGNQRLLAERKKFYESKRAAGWAAVGRKHGLDAQALDAINREGEDKRWPVPR